MDNHFLLQSLCHAAQQLHARNMLAAGDGNLSIRLGDGNIAMTPSGVAKATLTPNDFALLDTTGKIIKGQPSSERYVHLRIYESCPQARVVIHAHPPTVIAWTLARPQWEALPADSLPEVILSAGTMPIVPYARPGSTTLADSLAPYLPQHRLLILARHGAVCWGENVEEALRGMERVEHVAHILHLAQCLGGASPLEEDEQKALQALRAQMGPTLR